MRLLPLFALLFGSALWLTWRDAAALLPPGLWWQVLAAPDLSDPVQLVARYAFAPRVAVSILAGAALGLCGLLFTRSLRNPLAEPTTLGTTAGASLALAAATLFAPSLLANGREGVALAGAGAATLLTFALGAGRVLSPVSLVLSGLVVTMLAGSATATLMALKSDDLAAIFVWQSGTLAQGGDAAWQSLLWQFAVAAALTALLARPLTVLGIDDRGARALGASPGLVRILAVLIGVGLSASVTASVGVIAFVGLAAPALVRLSGGLDFKRQLVAAPVLGALVLWLVDRMVAGWGSDLQIPTGAATALLGAPVLLLLLPFARAPAMPVAQPSDGTGRASRHSLLAVVALAGLLALAAFAFGRGPDGWEWTAAAHWSDIAPFRVPRIAAALAAGGLLAVAGVLLQRLTGNPMASPELLGASGGATLGVLVLMILLPQDLQRWLVLVAASLGALAAIALLLAFAARGGLPPERLLLTGFLVSTFATSLAALVLASGDPRTQWLQSWLTGSTYRATTAEAAGACLGLGLLCLLLPLVARWLAILPLGPNVASNLGIPLVLARSCLLLMAGGATAVATVVIGPLSFVGLIAPHLARLWGFHRPLAQLYAAMTVGAAMLVAADWVGRTVIFPWQVPAGPIAALVGAPAFVWLMRRRGGGAPV